MVYCLDIDLFTAIYPKIKITNNKYKTISCSSTIIKGGGRE